MADNKLVRGLFSDTRPINQPDGTYPFAKNGVQHDITGAVANEPGFLKEAAAVPYQFIGLIETDSTPVLFSTDGVNSAIGLFNPGTGLYEPVVDDNPGVLTNWPSNGDRLGFSKDFYITGESQRNYKGELVVAFTDKNKFPKYLNCITPNIRSVDDLRLFPISTQPEIVLSEVTGGGLPAGTYYVAITYEKLDGAATQQSEVSDGLTIAPGVLNVASDKAVRIQINNADQNYNHIRITVVSKVNGITKAVQLLDTLQIVGPVATVTYTGDNFSQDIDLTEVLTPFASYDRVHTLTQLNDSLYLGDLHKDPDITDMQPYANLITLNWQSKLLNAIAPPSEHVQGREKSFMHEEVYAVYVQYHKVKGGFTRSFIIPGLAPIAGDLAASTEAIAGGGSGYKKFSVEDTIRTFNVGTKTGTLGIWENETETYPNDPSFNSTALGGPDLTNGGVGNVKVRHHKFPSLRWCKANLYNSDPNYGKTHLDILGLVPGNVTIPARYIGIIDGYRILYAKRTAANQSVYGQSLLLHGCVQHNNQGWPLNSVNVYSSGQNWRTDVYHKNAGDYNDDWELRVRQDTMRFHSFDMLFNRPSISPTFISSQYKLKSSLYEDPSYYEDGGYNGAIVAISILADFTRPYSTVTATNVGQQLKKVGTSSYLPAGISVNRFINTNHETCYAGALGGTDWPLYIGSAGYESKETSTTRDRGMPAAVEAFVVNLIGIKGDMYSSFMSQKLVSAGTSRPLTNVDTLWGGDTFVSAYTFHTYGRHDSQDNWGSGSGGKKIINRFVCESASNINLRYETPGNDYSKFFPMTSIVGGSPPECYITTHSRSQDPNQFGYSRDFGALNDFLSSTIYNPNLEEILDYPYRIHRTGKLSRQSRPRNWRTALPLDFYECQKNMGPIINLSSAKDRLIIHHANALFMTQDKAKLETGALSITLGTGDIFQFEPQETEHSKLGFAGTQHDLACAKLPIGYAFIDSNQGELFLFKDKLQNLTVGVSEFLRTALRVAGKNNYNGTGLTIGWDHRYKRILVTAKNGATSFTLSWNAKNGAWAFYHDYIPDMYMHTRNQLYTIYNSKIYKHNAGPVGLYYQFPPKPSSFFVDVIFKAGDTREELLLETINWQNDYLSSTNADQPFQTLTHISVWDSKHHSGRISLRENQALQSILDTRRTQGYWSFSDFRNVLITEGVQFLENIFNNFNLIGTTSSLTKAWYDKELIQDTWFCVRFEFDNRNPATIVLHDATIQAQKSDR